MHKTPATLAACEPLNFGITAMESITDKAKGIGKYIAKEKALEMVE